MADLNVDHELRRRFLAKFTVGDGCWQWNACAAGGGYGQIGIGREVLYAHRLMYEWLVGPIPEGMVLDHICHRPADCYGGECAHRRCVRPDHLEVVTRGENVRRGHTRNQNQGKTECAHGHPYSTENTYVTRDGRSRHCRTCARTRALRYYHARKRVAT